MLGGSALSLRKDHLEALVTHLTVLCQGPGKTAASRTAVASPPELRRVTLMKMLLQAPHSGRTVAGMEVVLAPTFRTQLFQVIGFGFVPENYQSILCPKTSSTNSSTQQLGMLPAPQILCTFWGRETERRSKHAQCPVIPIRCNKA